MITLQDGSLLVDHWEVRDPAVVRFFSAVPAEDDEARQREWEELLLRAVTIGVIALQRAETQVDLDAVRHEFEAWHRAVEGSLEDVFKQDNGKLATALSLYLGEGGRLAELFDPQRKDSAIGRVQAIFDQHFTGDGAKFALLLDCTNEQSPLRKLQGALSDQVKGLETKMDALKEQVATAQARKEERQLGTAKGRDFEEVLYDLLSELARPFGDQVVRVGDVAGIAGSKVGDVVIELNEKSAGHRGARMVVEAKTSGRAVNAMLKELQQATNNREAVYALAVYSDDACPAEVGALREYPDNRLLCSIPADGSERLALEVAYRLARAQTCLQLGFESREIDRAAVSSAVRAAKDQLNSFRALKLSATGIQTAAQRLHEDLGRIESEVRAALDAVLSELEQAPAEVEPLPE
jgi:hypothetical protein